MNNVVSYWAKYGFICSWYRFRFRYAFIFSSFCFFQKFFELFFQSHYMNKFNFFSQILDYNCITVFPKLSFLFSILNLILSRNMCKSFRKLRNGKIYPLEVRIFFNCFHYCIVILWTIGAVFPHIWAHIIKTVFFSIFNFCFLF